ncbi:hypothetical protein F0562_020936 [Nyssa sinensis]|uniref:LysM domain-containing protein n=1 Tax=Nyssa sinensis TaxID=561372 RepID=A0A5J5BVT4_9ASTE|nr:hypothetical protein F0562_020936 [Nyssa sinensis]
MGFSFLRAFLTLSIIYVFAIASSTAQAQTFRCTSTGRKCNALIDFVSPNATTLSAIRTLFGVRNLRTLLGANNFPFSTPSNRSVSARQIIKIPFPCMCTNGTGISNRRPNYTVVPDDTLSGIAEKVFAGLVTFQQIQNVNNIPNPDLILVGQVLWIPLPCSCDDVHEERVVHYGHMVASGSTVDGLAQQYNTSAQTLLTLNELASPNDLKANVPFDVPLKACTSRIVSNSEGLPFTGL